MLVAESSVIGPFTIERMTPFESMKNWVGRANTRYSRKT